jgi:hypothetical protein
VIKSHDSGACIEKGGGVEGKQIHEARRKQNDIDKAYFGGKEKAAAAHQATADGGFEEDTVDEEDFEATVRRAMAARMQGEAGCAGLRAPSTELEDMEETELQVFRAGAFVAEQGYKQIDNGLSYFQIFFEQKWFPLGGTTAHKVSLKVAKEASVKAVKAAVVGPVFAKIGPDTNGIYHYVGGDEHVGICDARFAELVYHNRLEHTTKNAKTGHRFVTAEDQLILNYGMAGLGNNPVQVLST